MIDIAKKVTTAIVHSYSDYTKTAHAPTPRNYNASRTVACVIIYSV